MVVIPNLIVTSRIDRGFDQRSIHTNTSKIGMLCFFAYHVALRIKSKLGFEVRIMYRADEHIKMLTVVLVN